MHPEVISFGKIVIHFYGLLLAISFIMGLLIANWLAKRSDLNPVVISDMGFWVIISAIVGARLYYVLLHMDEFRNNLLSIFNPFQKESFGIGGLVMLGGYIGALAAGLIYLKLKKLPILQYLDVCAPSFAFGEFLTRIGCFMNGCCYGMPVNNWTGVHFQQNTAAGYYQELMHVNALFPSQLLLSAGSLVIGIVSLSIALKKRVDGFIFYFTGILMMVLRFFVDFTRYYSDSERFFTLSHNQIICIIIIILFSVLLVMSFKNSRKSAFPTKIQAK